MQLKIQNNFCLFGLLLLIAAGCANVVTPAGGEKDTTPPQAISFSPDTNSLNFSGGEIKIQFNEFIQLNDVFNQLIVSPPLENTPECKLRGKTLTIKITDTLKENTTYTLNFGQSIKDLTEGNTLDNFVYVFSTGETLDSLSVSGIVYDMTTTKLLSKMYVVLYRDPNDSSFTTSKPYYFARTDAEGKWKINNIRAGNYAIYALEDMNFNYFYDLPNERIAFSDTLLYVSADIRDLKLGLFPENKLAQALQEIKSPRYGLTRMVFTKPAGDVQIQYTGIDTSKTLTYYSENKDSVFFWQANYALDTHALKIQFDTTVLERSIPIARLHKDSLWEKQYNTFRHDAIALSKVPGTRADWDPERKLIFTWYNPVVSVADSFQVFSDSVLVGYSKMQIDPLNPTKTYLYFPWTSASTYDVIITGNRITDLFGLGNKADTIRIATRKADAYSTLTMRITNKSDHPLVLSLLRMDGAILETWNIQANSSDADSVMQTIQKKYLLPGVYRIKVIVDADNNGAWTTGDLSTKKQPEKIMYYSYDQNLRANWENEIDWEIK